MNLIEVKSARPTTADQLALKNEAHRLLQNGLENHGPAAERLALALNSIPLSKLDGNGAAAVIYTARLCERCGISWEALRLLAHFEPAMRALGDPQMSFTLWLRKARAGLLTGDLGGAIDNLASALSELKAETFVSTVTELWMFTAWAWREAGFNEPTLLAVEKVLELETRPANGDGYQALAVNGLVEMHAAMGNVDLAIEQGLRFARSMKDLPLTNAPAAGRIAYLYLSLVRLLVGARRLEEASEILELSKACVRPDWIGAGRTVALIVATCASAAGDSEKFDELTEPFFSAPGMEDAMRRVGMRVRVSTARENASTSEAAKRAAAEQQAMREQKIEQLVAHIQWDIDSGARERRKASMSKARADTLILDNVTALASLRYDAAGNRMAVAGNVARLMALAAPKLDIDPNLAEVAGRLALIGYLFVPSRLLFAPPDKNSKAALAVAFLASQGAGELLGAFDDETFKTIGQAAQTLRLRSRAVDRTLVMAGVNAPPLAQLMAVALAAAEACIGKDGATPSAAEMRRAVDRTVRWLDPKLVEVFAAVEDTSLEKAGCTDGQIASSVRSHYALLKALMKK